LVIVALAGDATPTARPAATMAAAAPPPSNLLTYERFKISPCSGERCFSLALRRARDTKKSAM
jgi:hypothetical protein